MDRDTDPPRSPERGQSTHVRLPSARASLVLATVMLAIGIAVGAAVGPAPEASFAGAPAGLLAKLPLLVALRARQSAAARSGVVAPTPVAASTTPTPTPEASSRPVTSSRARSSASTETTEASATPSAPTKAGRSTPSKSAKLPAIGTVWLIELDGTGFEAADAQPSAAPYTTGTLLPHATLLNAWSALQAGAFAMDAALAEPPSAGAVPPLLHSIVQPPCPEGAPGASCAPETPGQLSTADAFLKAVLTPIVSTAAYREHGLIVITFTGVGLASQSELPVGSSTATLTYRPPAGAVLLSPFARAGERSSVAFDPTSPRKSLAELLR